MISRTGSNFSFRRARESRSRRFIAGFTLIEVMLATVILASGILFIYEAFFVSLDVHNYYSRYLKVLPLAQGRLWQAQDELRRLGPSAQLHNFGTFNESGREINWYLNCSQEGGKPALFKIELSYLWREGRIKAKLARTAYALYEE